MAILLHTNINTNAPRPLDSKTYVGTGQEYLNKDSIPSNYRFRGMRVYDISTKIEWELVPMSGNNININEFENAGTIGNTDAIYYWKNISFGATPMFFKNTTWLNETNVNLSTSSGEVLLTALTFGEVKKVLWTISKGGGQQEISKKETFTKTFSAGNYNIKFEVFDRYNNSISYNFTMNVTTVGVLGIESFTVTPIAGIKENGSVTRTYNFTLVTTEPIIADQLQTLDIGFTNQLLAPTSVSFITGSTFTNAVTLLSANSLSINGSLVSELNNIILNTDTVFTLTLQKYQESVLTATATYNSVNKIAVNSGTISYNQSTNQLSSTITLQTAYTTYFSVTGSFIINGVTYNYVANIDKRTFTFLQTNVDINPGTYNVNVTMLQTVATGIGSNTETYNVIYPMTLTVSEPEYTVTFHVKDDLPTPEYVENCTILISRNGILYRTLSAPIGIASTELSNSNQYSVTVSKDNYSSLPSAFIVNSSPITVPLTVSPIREFANSSISNVLPGVTCNVTYNLLPDNKYEEYAEITFTVMNGESEVYTKTENDLLDPDTFNTLAINSGWNTYALTVLITSYYYGTSISNTMTVEIGEAIPLWGYLPEIDNYSTKTISDVINDYITESVLSTAASVPNSYLSNQNNPHLLYQSVLCGGVLTAGYMWAAFPDTYPTYTHYADYGDPNYFAISTYFYSGTKIVGTTTYTIYVCIGSETPPPYFGIPVPGMGDLSLRTY